MSVLFQNVNMVHDARQAPGSTPIAPDQPLTLDKSTTIPIHKVEVAHRQVMTESRPWDKVPHLTITEGNPAQIVDVPMHFSIPDYLRRTLYRPLSGGLRRTLVKPQLQSDITSTDRVMKVKGMTPPIELVSPEPWYTSFTRTVG